LHELGRERLLISSDKKSCSVAGVLGFLAVNETGEQVRGNQGLDDQRFALQWIQNNIEKFGGDKSKVIGPAIET